MKTFLTTALLLIFTSALPAELSIVSTEHRDEDSFKRLSEYLTGERSDGRYSVFRSQEPRRQGFYVSLYAQDRSILSNVSKVRLHFIRAGTQEIGTREMEADGIEKRRILVGLTEEEWESSDARPVAWKIELLDAQDQVLEEARSFLWSE